MVITLTQETVDIIQRRYPNIYPDNKPSDKWNGCIKTFKLQKRTDVHPFKEIARTGRLATISTEWHSSVPREIWESFYEMCKDLQSEETKLLLVKTKATRGNKSEHVYFSEKELMELFKLDAKDGPIEGVKRIK